MGWEVLVRATSPEDIPRLLRTTERVPPLGGVSLLRRDLGDDVRAVSADAVVMGARHSPLMSLRLSAPADRSGEKNVAWPYLGEWTHSLTPFQA